MPGRWWATPRERFDEDARDPEHQPRPPAHFQCRMIVVSRVRIVPPVVVPAGGQVHPARHPRVRRRNPHGHQTCSSGIRSSSSVSAPCWPASIDIRGSASLRTTAVAPWAIITTSPTRRSAAGVGSAPAARRRRRRRGYPPRPASRAAPATGSGRPRHAGFGAHVPAAGFAGEGDHPARQRGFLVEVDAVRRVDRHHAVVGGHQQVDVGTQVRDEVLDERSTIVSCATHGSLPGPYTWPRVSI